MNKLLTGGQQTSELLYGFDESQETRRLELTTNKTKRNILCEHQANCFNWVCRSRKSNIWFRLYSYFKTK